jgi:hypothetical protein
MKKFKNADSLVWIIIGIFILSIALIWIINVLWFSQNTLSTYDESVNKYIIESNIKNITEKLSNDIVTNEDSFYIYKDMVNKEFKYLTWIINKDYKYINKLWQKVDPEKNIWKTYQIELNKKIDILKHAIYPPEINNIVFHYDATNIDWTNNSTLSDWDLISKWKDLTWNWNDAYQNDDSKQATYKTNIIWTNSSVYFNWTDNTFNIDQNILINDDWDWYYNRDYKEKSFAIVFKTWFDTSKDQVIYEQWGSATWYNFMIHDWNVYASIHNKADSWRYSASDATYHYEWDDWHKFKWVNLWQAYPDTIYFVTIVQDSSHYLSDWITEDDVNNTIKIYLNWVLVWSDNHVDPQAENRHIWLWSIIDNNVQWWDWDTISCSECDYYEWYVWELVSWNHALTNNEIRWIQNYFKEKWLWATYNIQYHRIENNIKKVN